jgi:hypothetical protein
MVAASGDSPSVRGGEERARWLLYGRALVDKVKDNLSSVDDWSQTFEHALTAFCDGAGLLQNLQRFWDSAGRETTQSQADFLGRIQARTRLLSLLCIIDCKGMT